MTYQLVISRLKEIILAHKFINEYGYGEISDIAVPEDKERPNYPYAFINPVSTTLGERSFQANFNLIVMTQVADNEDDELFGQSNCMKYINDILSQFVMSNDDPLMSVSFPVNMTPFKERFQDDVVGATANVTMTYGKAMSICDSPITGITPSTPYCPQVLVIDGDDSQHYVDAGDSYSCLPATPKSGIAYQRAIPWEGDTTAAFQIVGSVEWHRAQGTYNYTPPSNPVSVALKKNGYFGSDAQCLLAYDNAFGNNYRYTNDRGQQYTEGFNRAAENISDAPSYCIDHLTGLGFYVDTAYTDISYKTWADAIAFAHTFTYGGYDGFRVIDAGEFVQVFEINDMNNAWWAAYTPWMDPNVRNYGGRLWWGGGEAVNNGRYSFTQTNGPTFNYTADPNFTCHHEIKVRNHYI